MDRPGRDRAAVLAMIYGPKRSAEAGPGPLRAGAASAIWETSAELGGALSIAVLGSAVVAVYRRTLAALPTDGVPAPALEAARASLGVAADVAASLPAPAGTALLEASPAAFAEPSRSRHRSAPRWRSRALCWRRWCWGAVSAVRWRRRPHFFAD